MNIFLCMCVCLGRVKNKSGDLKMRNRELKISHDIHFLILIFDPFSADLRIQYVLS